MTSSPSRPAPRPAPPARGILGLPDKLPYQVWRRPPSEQLSWCIDRFWGSAWQVPAGRAVTARVLPHPTVNLTLESSDPPTEPRQLVITGVTHGVFTRTLTGTDRVFGIKLRPGVARLLTDTPVRALSGSGQPALPLVRDADRLLAGLLASGSDDECIAAAERWFARLPAPPPDLLLVQRAVTALTEDRTVRRVSDLTGRFGISERTLQRLFADYLGLTPGWVLRRGRLHAAAERLIQLAMVATTDRSPLAEVAVEFGYADQAHLTNDFRRIIGMPPQSWLSTLVAEHPISA